MSANQKRVSFFYSALLLVTLTIFTVSQAAANDGAVPPRQAIHIPQHVIATSQRMGNGRDPLRDDATQVSLSAQHLLGELLVVASIEGGLYGLERETGSILWSLPPFTPTLNERNETVKFGRLVSTTYGPKRRSFAQLTTDVPLVDAPDTWDGQTSYDGKSGREALESLQDLGLYVVEPSNGQVYVLSTTSIPSEGEEASNGSGARLSKLPLTLPQLVELSPFSFPGDASRVFVGHKSTSLVEIDAQTGELGAVFGGSSSSEGRDSVWCGQSHNHTRPPLQSFASATRTESCAYGKKQSANWAYVGRNDYTLSIHMRGRPALSQTLTFSTFVPNAADRELATLWSNLRSSPDQKIFMAMPEEKSVVCFDASVQAVSPREHQDRTLWISELGATAAGIFDVIYPASLSTGEMTRPLLVPHPVRSLDFLLGKSPASSEAIGADSSQRKPEPAYLGMSDGHLYVMGGEMHPLVAFSPRAPAGLPSWKHLGYNTDRRGATNCASFGCLIGSYEIDRGSKDQADAEGLLGLGPGHAPFLGIEDGSMASRQNDSSRSLPLTSQSPSMAMSYSAWFTPSMITSQILILLLLACLCGLVYVGGQELRKQQAEEARAAARTVTYEASAPSIVGESTGKVEHTTTQLDDSSRKLGDLVDDDQRDESKVDAIDLHDSNALTVEKRKGKRRRRGKRGGVAVASRETNRSGSVDDDEEIEKAESTTDADDRNMGMAAEEQAQVHYNTKGAPVSEASDNESTRKTALSALNSGLIDAEINEITEIAKSVDLGTVAKQPHYRDESASLNAEEGGQVMKGTEGQKIAARGEDRSLVISEDVLGYGSSGTVVFKGTFQGRAVAVKRLLRDFVDVAAKEVSLLESADSHANVIRYYYKETTGNFLFIALELCPASLSEIIERPNDFVELSAALKPKKALAQIASGLQHLHALSIVHRDIKPQNILVSTGANGQLKMLLSDFGLSKRLDGAAQASFSQTVNNPGGTFGWRAPEILNGEVVLDSTSASNRDHSTGSNLAPSGSTNDEKKRLTRAVDIFALGCVFYYVLSNGDHPFGSRYERELNIMRGVKDLSRLDGLGEEGHEAQHLIAIMISQESSERLSATQTLSHPYFWDAGRRLAFLQDTSDRFDIMDRDPPEAPLVALENNAHLVIGSDWHRKLDKAIMEDLNKRRSYDQKSVAALLRAIRNKKHHIHDVSPQVRRIFTAAGGARNTAGATNAPVVENLASNVPLLPDAFLAYFTARFPRLFLHAYEVVNGFEVLKQEVSFAQYFRPQPGND